MDSEALRQQLTCPITHCLFVDPVVLPCCGASVGREALRASFAVAPACPLCRSSSPGHRRPDFVDGLPVNRVVQSLVDALRAPVEGVPTSSSVEREQRAAGGDDGGRPDPSSTANGAGAGGRSMQQQSRGDRSGRRGGENRLHQPAARLQGHREPDAVGGDSNLEEEDDSRSDVDPGIVPGISVYRCGVSEINGLYRRAGYFDGAPKFSRTTRYNGRDEEFSLFRCRPTDGTRRWYISIVPLGSHPGTTRDIDFYYAVSSPNGADGRLPPRSGWICIPNSGGINPAPLLCPLSRILEEEDDSGSDVDPADVREMNVARELNVLGCGVPQINGIYRRAGYFDGAPKFTRLTRYNGRHEEFSLFRCRLTDGTWRWYISIVPLGSHPGTTKDIDFYAAVPYPNGADGRLPPRSGWMCIPNSAGTSPAPQVSPR